MAAEAKAFEQRKKRRVQLAVAAAIGLLVCAGGAFGWWEDRQARERRFEGDRLAAERLVEQTRNNQQIEALLDRSEAAIKEEDDVVGAQFAVGQAEKRAANLEADHLKERLARCRSATNLLVDLDRIDALRYASKEGNPRAVREWPGAFARIGVIVGQTPPAQAADAVNGSLARDRLLAALDVWLVFAAEADRADLAAIVNTNSPYNHPPLTAKLSYAGNRSEDFAQRFQHASTQLSIQADLKLIDNYDAQIDDAIERHVLKNAKIDDPSDAGNFLRTIPGIGKILRLILLYEIDQIGRFPEVGNFLSYARLVRCEHESAGKKKGSGGKKDQKQRPSEMGLLRSRVPDAARHAGSEEVAREAGAQAWQEKSPIGAGGEDRSYGVSPVAQTAAIRRQAVLCPVSSALALPRRTGSAREYEQ